jgi:hypothetical protein
MERLEKENRELSTKLQSQSMPNDVLKSNILHSNVVIRLHKTASEGKAADKPAIDNFVYNMKTELPAFVKQVRSLYPSLSERDFLICLLIKAEFKLSEISLLASVSPQVLTNTRTRLLDRMFHVKGRAKDFDSRLRALNSF